MKSLKQYETKKLFFKQYLFKVELKNQLNIIFRSENQKSKSLDFAREQLDSFASNYRNGQPLVQKVFRTEREVPMDDYLGAKSFEDLIPILLEDEEVKNLLKKELSHLDIKVCNIAQDF